MKKLVVLMGSLLLSANLWAEGGVIGGGGMGVVCKNDQGEETVELLDLYEARIAGKKLIDFQGEFLEDLTIIGKKIYPFNIEKQSSFAVSALALSWWFKNIPEGTVLNPTNDALPALLPRDCSIKQIASYQNNQLIYIDPALYEKMDYRNKLALVAHEYIYKSERDGDVKDSRYTRLIVGMAMEKEGDFNFSWANVRMEQLDKVIKRCESVGVEQESEFFVFPKGFEVANSLNMVVFSKLNGHNMLTMNTTLVELDESGVIKSEKTSLLDTGMGYTQMEFKSNTRGLFVSWSGFFPGDKFKNVEFICEDI